MSNTTTREESGSVRIYSGGLAFGSIAAASTMPTKLQNVFAAKGLAETDLLHLTYPLVHEGVNLNGDEFIAEEMEKAYHTLIGTPLDKDHNQDIDSIVGRHYDARLENQASELVIICDAYIYANLYPDIAIKLQDGSIDGVSMEARFAWAERTTDKRTLRGVNFIGAGLVRTPADHKARVAIKASPPKVSYSTKQIELVVAQVIQGLKAGKA